MRICATSDLHGFFPYVPDCDVCVMAGDIIGATSHEQERAQWIEFMAWAIELEARGIRLVWIAGNHEFVLQSHPHFAEEFPGVYLCDSGVEIDGVTFWGSPWQPWFHNWAFNAPQFDGEDFLDEKFSLIPRDVDVLITHSPPNGILDHVGQRLTGSTALARHVRRTMPTLHVFGHIHHMFGRRDLGTITFANVAHTKTEGGHYAPENPPVLFELARNPKERIA